jgi:hypothetical protein
VDFSVKIPGPAGVSFLALNRGNSKMRYERVGENDASARGVFDSEAGLAVLTRYPADRSREMIARQGLDVFDLTPRSQV